VTKAQVPQALEFSHPSNRIAVLIDRFHQIENIVLFQDSSPFLESGAQILPLVSVSSFHLQVPVV
jgi:hypothetical protein